MTLSPSGSPTEQARALALLRITLGAMFVWVFFENYMKGAYSPAGYASVINYYLTSGHAPAIWKSVMRVMAQNAALAGPIQALTEVAFGVCLIAGLLIRPVAIGAFVFLTTLWISEMGAAWIWELLVPMMVAVALAAGRAGRAWGLDGVLAARHPSSPLW